MKTAEEWADMLDDNPSGLALVDKQDIAKVIQQALEAQHRYTWARAIEAAAKVVESPATMDEWYMNQPVEYFIRALPCPPLTPKESPPDGK